MNPVATDEHSSPRMHSIISHYPLKLVIQPRYIPKIRLMVPCRTNLIHDRKEMILLRHSIHSRRIEKLLSHQDWSMTDITRHSALQSLEGEKEEGRLKDGRRPLFILVGITCLGL